MLAILFVTLAASPEPSLPAPRFVALPTPKFVAKGCACTVCDCATCDGSCSAATRNNAGEWVVKLDGRTFTVGGAETKDAAVQLAKKVAGDGATQRQPAPASAAQRAPAPLQYFLPTATLPGNCPNGQCPNAAPATATRRGLLR